jgi:acyl-CoA thioesterase-2
MTVLTPQMPSVVLLETLAPDRFGGMPSDLGLPRMFGGQLLAQGLIAASRTVADDRPAHSTHAYFLAGARLGRPVEYHVECVRDGGRLSSRQVTAVQDGLTVAIQVCSFARSAGGITHQRRPAVTEIADEQPTLAESVRQWGGLGPSWSGFAGLEIRCRPEEIEPGSAPDPGAVTQSIWQRVPEPMPDDPVLHQAMLLYASDVTQLAAALVPHGVPIGLDALGDRVYDGVSVDHAVWFHRPARADTWLLFEQSAPSAGLGRAFTRADVFTQDGTLVASVAQEGLVRDMRAGGQAADTPTPREPDQGAS